MAGEEKALTRFLATNEDEILSRWWGKVQGLALDEVAESDPCQKVLKDCYPHVVRDLLKGKDEKIPQWMKTINKQGYPTGLVLKCVLHGHSILREIVIDKLSQERQEPGWDLKQTNRFKQLSHKRLDQQMQKISDCYLEVYQEELLDRERRHFQLTERMPDVIYSYSPEKGLSFVSQASWRLLGTTPQEFYQQGLSLWIDHVHPEDRTDFEVCFKQQLETQEEMEYEYRLLHKNGEDILHVINRSTPVTDANGEVISVNGIVIDITERKKMEQEIRKRNRQLEKLMAELQKTNQDLLRMGERKSELVKIVAHDLRNPLNSIRLFTELLLAYKNSPQDYEDFLHRIDEETTRLMNLIDNFLDIERIEAGALFYKQEKVNLMDIVEHFVSVFKWEMEKKQISFELQNLDRLKLIIGDKVRLDQVFSNILGNAVKFTPRGGKICLSAKLVGGTRKADHSNKALASLKEEERFVKISIWNSGSNIPPQYFKQVFAKFFQVEGREIETKAKKGYKQKGSGLGLAIAKEVIEHHGGRIWVESKPNKGVTFFFTLPYGDPPNKNH